jgi:hypothetical protein
MGVTVARVNVGHKFEYYCNNPSRREWYHGAGRMILLEVVLISLPALLKDWEGEEGERKGGTKMTLRFLI